MSVEALVTFEMANGGRVPKRKKTTGKHKDVFMLLAVIRVSGRCGSLNLELRC